VTPGAEVLVIEDDAAVGHLITTVLRRHGFDVALAGTGRAGLLHLQQHDPGVVVLDVGLPDLDGWQVLQRIREDSAVPVLMLTGHADEPDKVRGLRGGADDYLTKPFGIDEFTARVEALLRRGHRPPAPTADVFVDGDLYVDFDRREVRSAGEEVALTPIEFKLLAVLVHRSGQVISGDELLRLAWDDGSGVASDRVKFSVHRLRRKLGWESLESSPIEAVRGVGYRYRPTEPA
jgi:DNA-binding response OmpR family regulator